MHKMISYHTLFDASFFSNKRLTFFNAALAFEFAFCTAGWFLSLYFENTFIFLSDTF